MPKVFRHQHRFKLVTTAGAKLRSWLMDALTAFQGQGCRTSTSCLIIDPTICNSNDSSFRVRPISLTWLLDLIVGEQKVTITIVAIYISDSRVDV